MMRLQLLIVSLVLAVTVCLAACGDDDSAPTNTDGAASPTAPPDDGGGNGSGGGDGSATLDFSGDVSGSFQLSGMSCDHLPNAADDETDDSYAVSISGNVGDEQYTLDISISLLVPDPSVRLTRSGEGFSTWDNEEDALPVPGAGTANRTDTGGDIQFDLEPADVSPGMATGNVSVTGSWTCPGEEYTTFG